MRIASAWAREICAIPNFSAATISGLFAEMAVERTMRSTPETFSALCPICIVAPSVAKFCVTDDSFTSEPETATPCAIMIRAIPLIPAPPIPMKWIFLLRSSSKVEIVMSAFLGALVRSLQGLPQHQAGIAGRPVRLCTPALPLHTR